MYLLTFTEALRFGHVLSYLPFWSPALATATLWATQMPVQRVCRSRHKRKKTTKKITFSDACDQYP